VLQRLPRGPSLVGKTGGYLLERLVIGAHRWSRHTNRLYARRRRVKAAAPAAPPALDERKRAAAVAMHDGPAVGLALLDAILARGGPADYHLAHSVRATLCRCLGRTAEARAASGSSGWSPGRRPTTQPAPIPPETSFETRRHRCRFE
jgi:predicted RNA polymerase sigma factor